MVVSKSVDPDGEKEFCGVPLLHEGGVLMNTHYFSIEVKVLSRTEISLVALAKADPNMRFIPFKLQQWGAKILVQYLFKKMLTYSQSFKGTVYEESLTNSKNKEFYEWLDKQLEEVYINNGFE